MQAGSLSVVAIDGCLDSGDPIREGLGYGMELRTWKSARCSRISSKHCLTLSKLGADVVAYTRRKACAVAIDRRRMAGNCMSPDVSRMSTLNGDKRGGELWREREMGSDSGLECSGGLLFSISQCQWLEYVGNGSLIQCQALARCAWFS